MRKGKPMISTQPALVLVLAPAAVALGVSAVYALLRPRPVIAELFLYIGLWLALPVLGVRLSYLAATAGYPPRDELFSAVDAALGFRWIEWVAFVGRHPWIEAAQRLAYDSHFWQPLATVAILALWGPPGRNREMLTAMLLATIATIAISALLPAL